ncbi:DNA cytosine methyltransferase [Chryseobacterium aquifrigidense]|uniref:DNA (Cytosine-5)-methyltransferase 1 n=1 Tax=Chryseobacterium aquifrigidense TaxID=558021 RepID=A0A543E9Q9_9FLAO|nr:DNA cytosine methyltransferase [Chryseobacterium aquifrigidense]TQM18308.1 DNA (cytosine-5)-methyltransferase 1 [Chryseobacterium aquifrigidense]
MKILNLYAGIGGNRKLWSDEHEITAVEIDAEIASVYKSYFPKDKMIVGDAHQYLLDHFSEFDFIWSSFPCVTHSRMNKNFSRIRYADLGLYQEILFLQAWFKGKYVVENVIPYYTPLIPAQQIHRHLFWANFKIPETSKKNPPKQIQSIIAQHTKRKRKNYAGDIVNLKVTQPHFGFDLNGIKSNKKLKMLRNCVDPETGKMILDAAVGNEIRMSIGGLFENINSL